MYVCLSVKYNWIFDYTFMYMLSCYLTFLELSILSVYVNPFSLSQSFQFMPILSVYVNPFSLCQSFQFMSIIPVYVNPFSLCQYFQFMSILSVYVNPLFVLLYCNYCILSKIELFIFKIDVYAFFIHRLKTIHSLASSTMMT